MLYAIIARDIEDSAARRRSARPDHLARLERLRDEGRLVLAGPLPAIDAPDPGPAGMAGSLIVAEFEDLDSARAWIESDPFQAAGVYREIEVHPFKQVLP